eukprot:TRINITY_DN12478_c0_g1_i4.p2 TRINITY_DN12478_c0_g1~~TRINITY_DN12478_c0_g1_i4.p2  ORF type:complete len:121 (+),score=34.63 TRINITY_DN12478_c0_g1_i4:3-365(+)
MSFDGVGGIATGKVVTFGFWFCRRSFFGDLFLMLFLFFFFFSSRRRHTRCREVSWARRCVQETGVNFPQPFYVKTLSLTEEKLANEVLNFEREEIVISIGIAGENAAIGEGNIHHSTINL